MKVIYSEQSIKKLKKLDHSVRKNIVSYMDKIELLEEPRARGKALSGNLRGFWRYRVDDYRVICHIEDEQLLILALDIDHRSKIYKNK